MPRNATHVHIDHGGADTDEFWDVGLNDEQLARADVDGDDRRGFSLYVDTETGTVSLNPGYVEGSKPYGEEARMFNEFRDSAVEALASHAKSRGILPAFLAMATAEETDRRRRLDILAESMNDEEDA